MLPAARGGAMIVSRGGAACGRLAQLVRAAGLQPAGRRFESGSAHGKVLVSGPFYSPLLFGSRCCATLAPLLFPRSHWMALSSRLVSASSSVKNRCP